MLIPTLFCLCSIKTRLNSVSGTPLPNEGRFIWKDSIDGYFETGNAAGKPAFLLWPLRQTPHMES